MSTGSDFNFALVANFAINQILGFQDVNADQDRAARLRDAFEEEHAWDDDTVGDTAWNTANPNFNIGQHTGNIGVATGTGQTIYYGDGSNILNIGDAVIKSGGYTGDNTNPRLITSGLPTACYFVMISTTDKHWFIFINSVDYVYLEDGGTVTMSVVDNDELEITGANFYVGDVNNGPNLNAVLYKWWAIGT